MEGISFSGFSDNQRVEGHLNAVSYTSEGAILSGSMGIENEADPASAREIAGVALGIDPELIAISDVGVDGIGSRTRSKTFGFAGSPWRVSWTPSKNKQGDPGAS